MEIPKQEVDRPASEVAADPTKVVTPEFSATIINGVLSDVAMFINGPSMSREKVDAVMRARINDPSQVDIRLGGWDKSYSKIKLYMPDGATRADLESFVKLIRSCTM